MLIWKEVFGSEWMNSVSALVTDCWLTSCCLLCVWADNIIDVVTSRHPVTHLDAGWERGWQDTMGRCSQWTTQSPPQEQDHRQIGLYIPSGHPCRHLLTVCWIFDKKICFTNSAYEWVRYFFTSAKWRRLCLSTWSLRKLWSDFGQIFRVLGLAQGWVN